MWSPRLICWPTSRLGRVHLWHGASFSVWPRAALLDVLTRVNALAAVNIYEQVRCIPARSCLAATRPRSSRLCRLICALDAGHDRPST